MQSKKVRHTPTWKAWDYLKRHTLKLSDMFLVFIHYCYTEENVSVHWKILRWVSALQQGHICAHTPVCSDQRTLVYSFGQTLDLMVSCSMRDWDLWRRSKSLSISVIVRGMLCLVHKLCWNKCSQILLSDCMSQPVPSCVSSLLSVCALRLRDPFNIYSAVSFQQSGICKPLFDPVAMIPEVITTAS